MRGNMKAERARLGLSAEQVAAEIGVSTNTILSWESGEKEPKAVNIIRLAKFYGCAAEYLLGMTDERKVKAKA